MKSIKLTVLGSLATMCANLNVRVNNANAKATLVDKFGVLVATSKKALVTTQIGTELSINSYATTAEERANLSINTVKTILRDADNNLRLAMLEELSQLVKDNLPEIIHAEDPVEPKKHIGDK